MAKKEASRILYSSRILPLLLFLGSLVGLIASFILTIDKFKILQNPSYVPSCNINPILSCGSVMTTSQASVFGFANSLIGIVGFAALMTVGLALLAGAKFKRWFWLLVQLAATFGVVFIHWLIFESLYRIGSLCPYCMATWAVVIPIFWYVTLYNLQLGNVAAPKRLQRLGKFVLRHHGDILIVWYLIIIGLALHRFWYYFAPHFLR